MTPRTRKRRRRLWARMQAPEGALSKRRFIMLACSPRGELRIPVTLEWSEPVAAEGQEVSAWFLSSSSDPRALAVDLPHELAIEQPSPSPPVCGKGHFVYLDCGGKTIVPCQWQPSHPFECGPRPAFPYFTQSLVDPGEWQSFKEAYKLGSRIRVLEAENERLAGRVRREGRLLKTALNFVANLTDSQEWSKWIGAVEAEHMLQVSALWQCRRCGCRWRINEPDNETSEITWSLMDRNQEPLSCCNNATMTYALLEAFNPKPEGSHG